MDKSLTTKLLIGFGVLLYFYFLIYSLWQIVSGGIAFWYDPARDLLSALDNLRKPTLIGPPAGIPGIFYGPYWIWFLSIGMLYSKDPRIIATVVLLIPYFTLFPYIMWKIAKQWGILTSVILGTLFYLHFNGYATQLWNPHLAPLFVFIGIYLAANTPFVKQTRMDRLMTLLAGFVIGLTVNVHISFGIGVVLGFFLFFIIDSLRTVFRRKKGKRRQKAIREYILSAGLFFAGVVISFLPFFLFEVRHGFHQVQTALTTLLHPHSVVGVSGLSDQQILQHYGGVFLKLFGGSLLLVVLFFCIGLGSMLFALYKKENETFSEFDRRVGLLAFIIGVVILAIYLTSKNPVWNYHFIGLEIIFIFVLGIFIAKLRFLQIAGIVVAFLLLLNHMQVFYSDIQRTTPVPGTLAAKEAVVSFIQLDASSSDFAVVAYNPAIYTFDYDYLFLTKLGKDVSDSISSIPPSDAPIYLIIPDAEPSEMQDFINAQTRGIPYEKISDRTLPDRTRVVKIIRTS